MPFSTIHSQPFRFFKQISGACFYGISKTDKISRGSRIIPFVKPGTLYREGQAAYFIENSATPDRWVGRRARPLLNNRKPINSIGPTLINWQTEGRDAKRIKEPYSTYQNHAKRGNGMGRQPANLR